MPATPEPTTAPTPTPRMRVRLLVNSAPYDVELEARHTLLDTLRDDLGLTGAKPGCNMGQCGA